ncbi:MAG: hypothetical protein ABI361_09350 [Nitrososphaera sp.]
MYQGLAEVIDRMYICTTCGTIVLFMEDWEHHHDETGHEEFIATMLE